jgi:hypothetical protein
VYKSTFSFSKVITFVSEFALLRVLLTLASESLLLLIWWRLLTETLWWGLLSESSLTAMTLHILSLSILLLSYYALGARWVNELAVGIHTSIWLLRAEADIIVLT